MQLYHIERPIYGLRKGDFKMKRKNGFNRIPAGYSKEAANEFVMSGERFTSCTVYPEVHYEFRDHKYDTSKILSVSYWVFQNIEGKDEDNSDGKQNPFLVKVETDKLEDMPFGTDVTFEDLQACIIARKFGSDTYFKAKSFKKVGK